MLATSRRVIVSLLVGSTAGGAFGREFTDPVRGGKRRAPGYQKLLNTFFAPSRHDSLSFARSVDDLLGPDLSDARQKWENGHRSATSDKATSLNVYTSYSERHDKAEERFQRRARNRMSESPHTGRTCFSPGLNYDLPKGFDFRPRKAPRAVDSPFLNLVRDLFFAGPAMMFDLSHIEDLQRQRRDILQKTAIESRATSSQESARAANWPETTIGNMKNSEDRSQAIQHVFIEKLPASFVGGSRTAWIDVTFSRPGATVMSAQKDKGDDDVREVSVEWGVNNRANQPALKLICKLRYLETAPEKGMEVVSFSFGSDQTGSEDNVVTVHIPDALRRMSESEACQSESAPRKKVVKKAIKKKATKHGAAPKRPTDVAGVRLPTSQGGRRAKKTVDRLNRGSSSSVPTQPKADLNQKSDVKNTVERHDVPSLHQEEEFLDESGFDFYMMGE
ncbi:unnamed protein product [Amoebophrya sp. A120]|nr:unnamed protein product [Amoebophrya sp. A120]|eukprot:GSA120T00000903001.1